jgi:hypothetical protein
MTSGHSVWTFDASFDAEVLHLVDHMARAVDGDLGQIAHVSIQPNRGYIILSQVAGDNPRILPAGSVASHEPDGAVRLSLTTTQVAQAPEYDADRRNERDYYDMLAAYFEPLLVSSCSRRIRARGPRRPARSCATPPDSP